MSTDVAARFCRSNVDETAGEHECFDDKRFMSATDDFDNAGNSLDSDATFLDDDGNDFDQTPFADGDEVHVDEDGDDDDDNDALKENNGLRILSARREESERISASISEDVGMITSSSIATSVVAVRE
jgi:hypothetical protein